jgi:hypothetical protein
MHKDYSNASANLSSNPLWSLPITDPRCANASCYAFLYGYLQEQIEYSNYNYPFYAKWIVFFYTATLATFLLLHLWHRFNDQRRQKTKRRIVAYWRMLNYRRVSGRLGNHVDMSYGQLILLTISSIFITILPFFQGHFIRDLFRFGSPPLSVRCAMLISAMLPLCLALAGKVNIVTLLTGISYAKLNLYHRYVAYVIYVLAVVHLVYIIHQALCIVLIFTNRFLTSWLQLEKEDFTNSDDFFRSRLVR